MSTDRITVCMSHADPQPPSGAPALADASPAMHEAWDRAREVVHSFAPELVVFFGTDHRRAFREVIPTVAVALAASARGDRGGPTGEYDVPSELSRMLASGLVARDIDAAVAYHPALDHAFGLTARDLLGGIDRVPIVPVFLNSASPPVPTLRRAAAIGRATAGALAERPERILFVGSGGLTHDLPGFYPLDDGVDWPEEERLVRNARLNAELRVPGRSFSSDWDRSLLEGLATTEEGWLESADDAINERAGNGAHEVLTWVAAWAAGGGGLGTLCYEWNGERRSGTAVAVSSAALETFA